MWYLQELYLKYKSYKRSKALSRCLDEIESILGKHTFMWDTTVYPKFKVYNCVKFEDNFKSLSRKEHREGIKCASMSRLPIIKTERSIAVTQIPCSPLKFVPSYE